MPQESSISTSQSLQFLVYKRRAMQQHSSTPHTHTHMQNTVTSSGAFFAPMFAAKLFIDVGWPPITQQFLPVQGFPHHHRPYYGIYWNTHARNNNNDVDHSIAISLSHYTSVVNCGRRLFATLFECDRKHFEDPFCQWAKQRSAPLSPFRWIRCAHGKCKSIQCVVV